MKNYDVNEKYFIFSNFHILFGCFFAILIMGACTKDTSESKTLILSNSSKEIKFQKYLSERKSKAVKPREDESYTVDESVYVLESILNYDYSFGTNRSNQLLSFQDTIYIQTDNQSNPSVSENELDEVYDEIVTILTDYYENIEGSNDTLIVVSISRIDNINGQGLFPVVCTSLFSAAVAEYLEDEVQVDCLEFLAPFPEGDDLEFGLLLGYCDNRNVPETDAAVELAKEINQTFDPDPRIYYNDIKITCAAEDPFRGKCLDRTVFEHDVEKPGETLDNILDAKVFARYGNRPNYSFCVPYNHLNCYFAYMMLDVSEQYNDGGRVFFCIYIKSDLIPNGYGAIGHGNSLYYGIKRYRLIPDVPHTLPIE